jgi:hypothetical protein
MEDLAGAIRKEGFTPGIWVAPFAVQQSSRLFREHPEWMVKDAAGAPLAWEVAWAEPKEPWYGLDAGNPDALTWLRDTFAALRRSGYRYFKLDFLFMGCLRGGRSEQVTRVEAFRKGLAAIRSAVGDSYILACTAPFAPCVGLVDGIRVSHDVMPGASLAEPFREAFRETCQRHWAHGSLWSADGDVAVLRPIEGEAPAVTGAVAAHVLLSGGAVMDSDALAALPPDRAGMAERLFRSVRREAGVPQDLFGLETPRCVVQPAGRGRWRVGLFNFDDFRRVVALDLGRLGLRRAVVTPFHDLVPGTPVKARGRYLTPPIDARGALLLDVRAA